MVWYFSGMSTIKGLIAGAVCILVGSLVVGDVGEDMICWNCCALNCYVCISEIYKLVDAKKNVPWR